ncbi:hypothetical protein [Bacillus phage vB_Bpu_PumA2]|uniref:Uncharacterized protein n=1 Tax=Bacillus phage vB_Bpu_PumA2 TaxID=2662128 RepID=A0A5Q2WDT2_9CAUD|nr:hypothetical protein H3021_gp07 [Bacillus phage vB_Bpu_PumA2]QGH74226.1 hypothetical protein [Bacillus phage vB_Bpu_PumA2]
MIENVQKKIIFITVGKMYVSHVSYSDLSEEIIKLDMDKVYGNLSNNDIEKCFQLETISQAQKVCRYLLDMGLKPTINKRSTVIRDEEFTVTEENKFDDLTGGIKYDTI